MDMSMAGIDGAALSAKVRQGGRVEIGIWSLLVWAFSREFASLDFDEVETEVGGNRGFGMEYVLIERARLGCSPDGGGRSEPHPDADIVAAALMTLPEGCGGRRMAVTIAEFARSGRVPDCRMNARPTCAPVEWRNSKHGKFAAREFWTGRGRWPECVLGRDYGYVCPVRYTDTAREVAQARRGYLAWWGALLHLRAVLAVDGQIGAFALTDEMPPREPWKKKRLTEMSVC